MTAADEDRFGDYRGTVAERLRRREFSELDAGLENYQSAVFHRRGVEVTKFGLVDTFVVLASFGSPAPRSVAEFSSRAFSFGLDRKSRLPRGLGGGLVVYAVAACEEAPPGLTEWATGYKPSHFAAFEFPVVADLARGRVHYYTATPLIGGAYYKGFRETAAEAFEPAVADPDLLP